MKCPPSAPTVTEMLVNVLNICSDDELMSEGDDLCEGETENATEATPQFKAHPLDVMRTVACLLNVVMVKLPPGAFKAI